MGKLKSLRNRGSHVSLYGWSGSGWHQNITEDRTEQTQVHVFLFYRLSFYIPCLVCPNKVIIIIIILLILSAAGIISAVSITGLVQHGPLMCVRNSVSCLLIELHSQANHSLLSSSSSISTAAVNGLILASWACHHCK